MKILNIVGARPNFMKMAPIVRAMNAFPDELNHLLVHTGQHYDAQMSDAFFDDLDMPRPDVDLGVGSGSHAQQTARIMMAFEETCLREKPDLVVVVGDVNSTMACTITAKKLGIKVAHVEAGLRSGDMTMPEELNRLCTDVICDFHFTTDEMASENLRREGIDPDRIHFVGNVMIDTLLAFRQKADALDTVSKMELTPGAYSVLTLHRPSNVDDRDTLAGIIDALDEITASMPVIFPAHPRTRQMIEKFDLQDRFNWDGPPKGIRICDPLGYLEMLDVNANAKMVLTDSGGLQEETTVLGVPCITLRFNTERPITLSQGTNQLVGNDPTAIRQAITSVVTASEQNHSIPEKWDGRAAERITDIIRTAAH